MPECAFLPKYKKTNNTKKAEKKPPKQLRKVFNNLHMIHLLINA